MQKRLGFTLIELLVVIAIIAILAAILFPVFVSARNQARMSSCQCNMKQCASAIFVYSSDNNGMLPMVHWGPDWGDESQSAYWGEAIKKYCGTKRDIVYCPSNPPIYEYESGSASRAYYYDPTIGMNVALGYEGNGCYIPSCRLDEVRAPSKTIMLGDASQYLYTDRWGAKSALHGSFGICPGNKTQLVLGGIKYLNPWSGWHSDFFDPNRHNNKVNIACVDGHVGSFKRDFLLKENGRNSKNTNFTWWDRW